MKKGMIGQKCLNDYFTGLYNEKFNYNYFKRNKFKIIGWNRRRLEALSIDENNTDIEGSLIKLQKELDIGTLK